MLEGFLSMGVMANPRRLAKAPIDKDTFAWSTFPRSHKSWPQQETDIMQVQLTKNQKDVFEAIIASPVAEAYAKTKWDARVVNNLKKMGLLVVTSKGQLLAKGALVDKEDSKAEKVESVGIECLCGCGQTTAPKRVFVQGHDARLRSNVLKWSRNKGERSAFPRREATLSYLINDAHWMTDEIRAMLKK